MRTSPLRVAPMIIAGLLVAAACGPAPSPVPITAPPMATSPEPSFDGVTPTAEATAAPTPVPTTLPVPTPKLADGPGTWITIDGPAVPDLVRAALAGGGRALLLAPSPECAGLEDGETLDGYTPVSVYDPGRDTLVATSSPAQVCTGFEMTTLKDGRVLVAGGFDARWREVSTTSFWDPATGQFANGPDMILPRSGPSLMTLPDGRVLAAGGAIADGVCNGCMTTTPTAEIYDPGTNRWASTEPMPWWEYDSDIGSPPAVALAGGQVLALEPGMSQLVQATYLYDPGQQAWIEVPPPDGVRLAALVGLPDGSALVIDESGTALRFDPESGWRSAGALTTARDAPAAVAVLADGRVFVAGGHDRSLKVLRTVELFDPDTGRSSDLAPMPEDRNRGEAVPLADGSVLLAGGCGGACAPLLWSP